MSLPDRPSGCDGFSILELVAALAILGFAILVTAAVLSTESDRAARLAARHQAVHALEATLEDVRAGIVPLQSSSPQTGEIVQPAAADNLRITLNVAQASPPDLYRVEATARWRVRGRAAKATLTTLIWRP
ncbi:MAG: type II secretion system GspH family protein [Acidobacteria bacterium]|jgi:type II secretory pathway pseudopilin PulG|nr:type II secretion system GspH family protein [Acidobacteriota bacterium]